MWKNKVKKLLLANLVIIIIGFSPAVGGKPAEQSPDYLKADCQYIQNWRQLKFGMFIHWGPASLLGIDSWSRGGERRGQSGSGDIPVQVYDNLYKSFYPAGFDANEWVKIAKQAGMKYIIFTTKHHDGFCMFDSDLTDYKITNTPYGGDILKELADACHRNGLKLGFYYSQPDWHHPDYRTQNHSRYIEYLHGQMRELCAGYGQVDMIFFDGLGGSAEDSKSKERFEMIRSLQPKLVINNRAGLPGDYDAVEQQIGSFRRERPWETCMTLGRKWFWNTADDIKSLKECIQALAATVGGDGNFCLNVGPMPTGKIEPRQIQRLKQIGNWLEKYGRSIFNTRGGPYKSGTWGASTYRDNKIYLHIFHWLSEKLNLPLITRRIKNFKILTGGKLKVNRTKERITFTVPKKYRHDIDTIIELELDGPAGYIEPLDIPSGSLAYKKKAHASTYYHKRASNRPAMAFDDDDTTCWRASTNHGWLQVDLGKPCNVDTAVIQQERQYFSAEKYELLCEVDGRWKKLAAGEKLPLLAVLKFDPVKARRFRIKLSRRNLQPIIRELHLFGPEDI